MRLSYTKDSSLGISGNVSGSQKNILGRQNSNESKIYSGKCKDFSINQPTQAVSKERKEVDHEEQPEQNR